MDLLQTQQQLTHGIYSALEGYAPYSPVGYLALLGLTFLFREFVPSVTVSKGVEFWHNLMMVFQSVVLTALTVVMWCDIARIDGTSVYDVRILNSPSRFESAWYEFALNVFLVSKLWESLDTVMLILKKKRPLLLHLVHHCTTFWAFYSGGYCTSFFVIGFANSVIHIVMYTFYSGVAWIKPYARYITTMQITHLTCGGVANVYSYLHPIHPYTRWYAVTNCALCFTYMGMFVVFFGNKYKNKAVVAAKVE